MGDNQVNLVVHFFLRLIINIPRLSLICSSKKKDRKKVMGDNQVNLVVHFFLRLIIINSRLIE
jgi:hypothetical protein